MLNPKRPANACWVNPSTQPQTAAATDLQYLMVKRTAIADPSMQAEWSKKRLVWVPHETEGFVKACVLSEDGETNHIEY